MWWRVHIYCVSESILKFGNGGLRIYTHLYLHVYAHVGGGLNIFKDDAGYFQR